MRSLIYQPIKSLNANARKLSNNRKTAERKIQRVVHTKLFPAVFIKIFHSLKLINKGGKIIIDFSDFNGRQVLMFAKQTKKGRSIPLYFKFLKYPINKGSQNLFITNAIGDFLAETNYDLEFYSKVQHFLRNYFSDFGTYCDRAII